MLREELEAEEQEVKALEQKLKDVPDNDSNYTSESEEVRILEEEEIEVKPLEPLLPLPELKAPTKPVIVKQPPLPAKPKKKKVKEDEKAKAPVETASQEVNTVLVMPKSKRQLPIGEKSRQHQTLDEHIKKSRASTLGEGGEAGSPAPRASEGA